MTQRVHEIGIRMALGAERQDVLRMIIGQGLQLALAWRRREQGRVTSGARAVGFSHLLYGVRASRSVDAHHRLVVLMTAALLACYLPARRAARVDPIVALRHIDYFNEPVSRGHFNRLTLTRLPVIVASSA